MPFGSVNQIVFFCFFGCIFTLSVAVPAHTCEKDQLQKKPNKPKDKKLNLHPLMWDL